ncbi:hypothetical protein [Hymenobacter qilianensis]|uniref:Uncharacterized protein n=1 Tax=Hymenobacter qilianensis TaxID=1385715 RepID=A0A7H0GVR1_9BACT|nr:hypothetical protein [Hymenobacter qilianensis]QNP52377.1 hypothetical protein H9L05_00810 [Hymenobacter qilianensis]
MKHFDQCLLSLFQDEAISTEADSEMQYADAEKHSTNSGFAAANALAGSFAPLVD